MHWRLDRRRPLFPLAVYQHHPLRPPNQGARGCLRCLREPYPDSSHGLLRLLLEHPGLNHVPRLPQHLVPATAGVSGRAPAGLPADDCEPASRTATRIAFAVTHHNHSGPLTRAPQARSLPDTPQSARTVEILAILRLFVWACPSLHGVHPERKPPSVNASCPCTNSSRTPLTLSARGPSPALSWTSSTVECSRPPDPCSGSAYHR